MNNLAQNALNQYQSTGNSSLAYANPHELILRLMNGAIERISQAKGAIERGETAQKGELLSKAIKIIGGLEGCLDYEQGGELSNNLGQLYEYMVLRLAQVNMDGDTGKLDEVTHLMQEIRSAWAQLPERIASQG